MSPKEYLRGFVDCSKVCFKVSKTAASEEAKPATRITLSSQKVAVVALAILGVAMATIGFYALYAPNNVILAKLGRNACAAIAALGCTALVASALLACLSSSKIAQPTASAEEPNANAEETNANAEESTASDEESTASAEEPTASAEELTAQPTASAPLANLVEPAASAQQPDSAYVDPVDPDFYILRFKGQEIKVKILRDENGRGGVRIDGRGRAEYVPINPIAQPIKIAFTHEQEEQRLALALPAMSGIERAFKAAQADAARATHF